MNFAHRIQILDHPPIGRIGPSGLAAQSEFLRALSDLASRMVRLHERHRRAARLISTQQKWLLTHAIYALYLERDDGKPLSGITATRLLDFISGYETVSRNTATAFLAELVAYRLLSDVSGNCDRRSRPLEPTGESTAFMAEWFDAHSACLDQLAGQHGSMDSATIVSVLQPGMARRLISDPYWREPPESISLFVLSQAGALVLDNLISRILDPLPGKTRYEAGDLRPSTFSGQYRVSATHLRRVFARAERLGLLGWNQPGRKGGFWLSGTLVRDYAEWQAIKLEALAEVRQAGASSIA